MSADSFEVVVHPNAERFLNRAEAWLLEREAQYNILLGIAHRLVQSTAEYDAPVLLATVESHERVEGCVFRTPPHKLGVTTMPPAAVQPVVRMVADRYQDIPAILGPEPVAEAFAREWSKVRSVRYTPGMKQRIYRLDDLRPLQRQVDGFMRSAVPADLPAVTHWIGQFTAETGVPTLRARDMAELLIDHDALVLWDDGGSKSMAGTQGFTANGVRISYVFTPRPYRGRGYATALVHALSRIMLENGRDYCVLYTDLSNPTSNAIYPRIGYEPVEDVRDYDFVSDEPATSAPAPGERSKRSKTKSMRR